MSLPEVSFSELHLPSAGEIVLFSFKEQVKTELFDKIDQAVNGALTRAIAAEQFNGKFGDTCVLLTPSNAFSHIVFIGLGEHGDFNQALAKQAGGIAAGVLRNKTTQLDFVLDQSLSEFAGQIALGAVLSNYHFDLYQTDAEKKRKYKKLQKINFFVPNPNLAKNDWQKLSAVAEGIYLTRNLVNEPANILTPPVFAERIQKLQSLGLTIEVLDRSKMQELGFGALLGVAQGSNAEARTVIIRWNGNPDDHEAPLAFLGKGVTFDSGGISLKPAAGMDEMKTDMAGAATVVGLMSVLAKRKAKVNVIGVVGLVENMVSGNAQRPGDIVRSASGQTIEVLNTDAEGRLVLADILWYTQDRFKPRFMVNLATLTGAIVVALGHEHAGLFSNNDELAAHLVKTGQGVNELLWRMPLSAAYDKALDSSIADMKNIGGRDGGSITAAQFLQRFVNNTPWAHLDIAGTAYTAKARHCSPKGGTAFGVCLLNQFVEDYYEA